MPEEKTVNLRELVEQDIAAINHGDWDKLDELYAEDFIVHGTDEIRGRAAYKQAFNKEKIGFPDMSLTVNDIIVEGDKVAVRTTIRGTHLGEYMGLKPTGKVIEIGGLYIERVANGKFVEMWGISDDVSFLKQLGMISDIPKLE
jgi:steroid delta-isomerase-like uncharacterized protein